MLPLEKVTPLNLQRHVLQRQLLHYLAVVEMMEVVLRVHVHMERFESLAHALVLLLLFQVVLLLVVALVVPLVVLVVGM